MKRINLFLFLFFQFSISFSQIEEIKDDYMWGKLENGQKIGYWQYFDEADSELSLMINYTTGQVSYIKKDTSKYLIDTGDHWNEANVVTPPHFIGSKKHIYDFLAKNIQIPLDVRRNGVEGVTIISAEIDETGNFGNFEIVKKLDGGFTEEALQVLSVFPNTWIQATDSSGAVSSKIIFIFRFGLGEEYKVTKEEKEKYPILREDKPYIIDFEVTAQFQERPR